jgi:hypothetical protein
LERRHKLTTPAPASLFSSLDPREAWLNDLEEQTALHRQRKAARLTARAKAIGLERRRANRLDGTVARSETGNVRGAAWESQWHLKRAKGAQTLFERVRGCGAPDGYRVELTCRGCSNQTSMPVGCGQTSFCSACRAREIRETRLQLLARFEGLTDKARRAGLMGRSRRHQKGGRFGLRFATFTAPHVGLPGERIAALYRAWPRFLRLLRDELRPKLSEELTGIWLEKKDGELVEQTLWNLFQLQRVSEWTPGGDGFGHPHFHALIFSPFIDQALLTELWTRAYNDVTNGSAARLVVDVRAAHGSLHDAIEEVCKYLVKDWELGAGRVSADVMAQVYVAYDGRRRRQASAGLGSFALPIVKACPCCNHENEGGHWARVRVTHTLTEALMGGPKLPWAQGPPLVKAGEDLEISTYEWATGRAAQKHHDRWIESEAGRSFVERLRRDTA